MPVPETLIQSSLTLSWFLLIASFVILFKCADMFVTASVGLAERFNIPRLIIGIVLVSLATTAPELAVSMTAARKGEGALAADNILGAGFTLTRTKGAILLGLYACYLAVFFLLYSPGRG